MTGRDNAVIGTSPRARLLGLDVARALAMLGMFIAHYGPSVATERDREQWPYRIMRFTDGRAMPLFVVLGGMGFALLVQRGPTVARVLPRAAILLAIGLWLEGGLVLVILHFYALYFLIGLLIYRLPPWVWLALGAATVAIGTATTLYLAEEPPDPWRITDDSWWSAFPHLGHPKKLLAHLTITGEYRVFPSFAFFLIGMWLARRDLRRLQTQLTVAAVGLVIALICYPVGWATDDHREGIRPTTRSLWWLLAANGHSQMPIWMAAATGFALAVIGASLVVASRLPRAVLPFANVGQLALTFYVAHVFLLRRPLRKWPWELSPWQILGVIATAYLAFTVLAYLYRRSFSYGPVEAVLRVGDLMVTWAHLDSRSCRQRAALMATHRSIQEDSCPPAETHRVD